MKKLIGITLIASLLAIFSVYAAGDIITGPINIESNILSGDFFQTCNDPGWGYPNGAYTNSHNTITVNIYASHAVSNTNLILYGEFDSEQYPGNHPEELTAIMNGVSRTFNEPSNLVGWNEFSVGPFNLNAGNNQITLRGKYWHDYQQCPASSYSGSIHFSSTGYIRLPEPPNTAPSIEGVPDQFTPEDTTPPWQIDLFPYASDNEQSDTQLSFSIISQTNSALIYCIVSSDRYITCGKPAANQNGYSDITVKVSDGQLTDTDNFRVTVGPVNDPPIASFSYTPLNPSAGTYITFDGSASKDPDSTIVSYGWNFGDGNTNSGIIVSHTYSLPGYYTATLTVSDGSLIGTYSKLIYIQSTECSDGTDNDADTFIDVADPGCHSDGNPSNPASYVPSDDDEFDTGIACFADSDCGSTTITNQCSSLDYQTITTKPTCKNQGTLNSFCKDEKTVAAQSCQYVCDDSLGCDYTECSDGKDNDYDGLIDYPNDPACYSYLDDSEKGVIVCSFDAQCGMPSTTAMCGTDEYVVATSTPTCFNPGGELSYCDDVVQVNKTDCSYICDDSLGCDYTQCSDSIDNDGDGDIDYPADLGCDDYLDDDESDETFQCSDGLDNDDDGQIDYPADTGCIDVQDDDESNFFDLYIDGGYLPHGTLYDDETAEIRFKTHHIPGGDIPVSVNITIDGNLIGISTLPYDQLTKDWGINLGHPLSAGTHELKIFTDNDNKYNESNEINNLFVFLFTVQHRVLTQCQDGIDNDGDGLVDQEDPGCNDDLDDTEDNGNIEIVRVDTYPGHAPWIQDLTEGQIVEVPSDSFDLLNDVYVENQFMVTPLEIQVNISISSLGLSRDGETKVVDPQDTVLFFDDIGGIPALEPGVYPVIIMASVWYDGQLLVDSFTFKIEVPELPIPQCSDSEDNDGDGLVDLDDPGCNDADDDDESNGTSQCQDGIDNDYDSYIDYPDDLGCTSPQDNDESDGPITCSTDNECGSEVVQSYCSAGNFITETTKPVCLNAGTEHSYCDKAVDSEIDYCDNICDNSLGCDYTECSDGVDNDGDNHIDFGSDLGCDDYFDDDESDGDIACSADIECGTPQSDSVCLGLDFQTTTYQYACINAGTEYSYCATTVNVANLTCHAICNTVFGCDYTQCSDGIDNDGDGFTDLDDIGCVNSRDNEELNYYTNLFDVLPRKTLQINNIRFNREVIPTVRAGDQLLVDLQFTNIGRQDISKATIRVTVPELGISRRLGPFTGPETKEMMSRGVLIDIPDDALPGEYTVRMSLSDIDGLRRIRHRDFIIE
ncbi:MAG TPA: PKD domain-containing protein [Candidatus Nanoarchaeia archaeon]|nr:PKD domain-containing protein [Candidatus Nanoarchaeia archaeon]